MANSQVATREAGVTLIDIVHYPALADSNVLHFDASAAFPIHKLVLGDVVKFLSTNVGTHGKASYDWAQDASAEYKRTKQAVATFINATEEEVFFVASASEGLRIIHNSMRRSFPEGVVYSPEDHSSVTSVVEKTQALELLSYGPTGRYDVSNIARNEGKALVYATQVHPLYGSDNNIKSIRELFPHSFLMVDASQAIGRTSVDVAAMKCDGLTFSAQKLGGLPGVGIVYIAKKHHECLRESIEPHTLPMPAIVGLRSAIDVLQSYGVHKIDAYLTRLTEYFIYQAMERVHGISFTKGPALSEYSCSGNGIVSFRIEGYSSQDVAMILNNQAINVRAGDHCVDANAVERDVVRVSFHAYADTVSIDRLVSALAEL